MHHQYLKQISTSLLLVLINFPLIRKWYASRLRYLVANSERGQAWLHLACGKRPFQDWINIDIMPFSPGTDILLDLRRPIPLPDNVIDLMYSEDFIEHLDRLEGSRLLNECYRILRPGGIMRLLTPNLRTLAKQYVDRSSNLLEWYSHRYGTTYFAEILNHGMRSWGHQFIYDDDMLAQELRIVGFKPQLQSLNQSISPILSGLDRNDTDEAEYRMYFECIKDS